MARLLLTLLLLPLSLSAAVLPKPTGIKVSGGGPQPVIAWAEVEGASLYRVAVFSAPDEEGKRELLGAVWVRGSSWAYGSKKVVPKAGKLPSTTPKPLKDGEEYRAMVSAAREDGSDKSDWAASDFSVGKVFEAVAPSPTPSPSPSFSPTPAPAADAKANSGEAELEVDLSGEFKETPEAGEGGLTKTARATATAEGARALLQAGKAEEAEAAYRELLEKDARNADTWEGLGDSYAARAMKVEAKEAYEKALAIDRDRMRLQKWLEENVRR